MSFQDSDLESTRESIYIQWKNSNEVNDPFEVLVKFQFTFCLKRDYCFYRYRR